MSCEADEHKDGVNHKCVKCSAPGGDYTYCTTCSNATYCKTCFKGKCYFFIIIFNYFVSKIFTRRMCNKLQD